jgi:hypothetical protein
MGRPGALSVEATPRLTHKLSRWNASRCDKASSKNAVLQITGGRTRATEAFSAMDTIASPTRLSVAEWPLDGDGMDRQGSVPRLGVAGATEVAYGSVPGGSLIAVVKG